MERYLVGGLIAAIALVTGLDIVHAYVPGLVPASLAGQLNLAGSWNAAAVAEAWLGVTVGGVALVKSRRGHARVYPGWALIGFACIAFALTDLLVGPPRDARLTLVVGALAGAIMLLAFVQIRTHPAAVAYLACAAILVVMNPVFDTFERSIAGEPRNYEFVSMDAPYVMTAPAWQSLEVLRQGQESTELLVFVMLLGVMLTDTRAQRSEVPSAI